jgi:hypothetical protein
MPGPSSRVASLLCWTVLLLNDTGMCEHPQLVSIHIAALRGRPQPSWPNGVIIIIIITHLWYVQARAGVLSEQYGDDIKHNMVMGMRHTQEPESLIFKISQRSLIGHRTQAAKGNPLSIWAKPQPDI